MRRAISLCAALLVSCAHATNGSRAMNVEPPPPMPASLTGGGPEPTATPGPMAAPYQVGNATWYGPGFAGKKTSNGERFDPRAMTAAHRKLPFGTWVEVRRLDTGRTVRVRINDRGPWGHEGRVIDLSEAAGKQLDIIPLGPTRVEIRIVNGPN